MRLHTFQPKTKDAFNSIWDMLLRRGYMVATGAPDRPHIRLIASGSGMGMDFYLPWIDYVIRSTDWRQYPPEWWHSLKPYRKHIELLYRQLGAYACAEFLNSRFPCPPTTEAPPYVKSYTPP
jgi:hypothetical protein